MNLPTDPKSFEEAATRIRIGCSIVQQGFAEVCRGRPDLEHQLRAAVGVIMKIVNEAQELEDTPVDPEMPMLQKEEHEEEEKETDGNAEERKQEQLCHEDADTTSFASQSTSSTSSNVILVALPKSAESQKSYPKISQPIDPSTVELFTDSEEDEAGPSTTLAPTTSKRPAPCQWRESSEERNSDEEKTSDYEEEVNKQKIERARRCKNPKREMEIVRRNRVQEKKAVVRTQTDPLVEGSQEWKEKFAEALEYHRTCCLYDDSVFGSINLLQLFRPPISGKPNGPLPQNVLPEIKTAKVLFLNWRKNTDTEKATSKALREEEWKEMSETDRNKWYKREEALFEESLVQLRKGFIRTTLLR
ncbi:Protein CBG07819 [Caenorhabditis briggsae]|uniref:Protein CBG07819 n=1 Tax=Caenorhabditis briggsae TaxID=6238 RepID=A8X579_CAEBR|nr:Protein CBG07819 [Caenorhabditis briggsae]CAP27778.2 Protein CBG07819 [Caenorhabditis briggsae]